MKRFWLSLLAMVLSLQMGLAAAHLCADDLPVPASPNAEMAQQAPSASEAANQVSSADLVSDTCCGGSVCHELHNAVNLAPTDLVLPSSSGVLNQADAHLAQSNFAVRHERPKWSAA